jgi:hypothetical protein
MLRILVGRKIQPRRIYIMENYESRGKVSKLSEEIEFLVVIQRVIVYFYPLCRLLMTIHQRTNYIDEIKIIF